MKRLAGLVLTILLLTNWAVAQQTAEVKITLDERFFDVLLEAVFAHLDAPGVPLTELRQVPGTAEKDVYALTDPVRSEAIFPAAYVKIATAAAEPALCDETIRLQKEIDGVKTAVRFRQGKIYAPIAFKGNYNPPLIGCIGFQGWAETNIDLIYDRQTQALTGRARVLKVVLSGTGGIGSGLLTRLVQSSIDSRINPIKILELERVSFTVPVQDSGQLRMKAVDMRHEVGEGLLNVFVKYRFLKG